MPDGIPRRLYFFGLARTNSDVTGLKPAAAILARSVGDQPFTVGGISRRLRCASAMRGSFYTASISDWLNDVGERCDGFDDGRIAFDVAGAGRIR